MFCPYCHRAKKLLDAKGAAYSEIDVMMNAAHRREMMQLAGGRHTVPQIFIGGQHIGGCDELYALEAAGRLDALLEEGTTA
jgi:glutaredoxin 3